MCVCTFRVSVTLRRAYPSHPSLRHRQHSLKLTTVFTYIHTVYTVHTNINWSIIKEYALHRFKEAYALYQKAIKLSDTHLGKNHASAVPLIVNYGIALVQGKHTQIYIHAYIHNL